MGGDLQNPTLLVIEDDRSLGEAICECLKDLFKKSMLATSFKEATDAIDLFKPDMIISDQNIPGGYGIDVLREARAKAINTVALIQTGAPSYELAIEAMRLGCVEFIEKPFDADHLHLRVEQILLYERKKRNLLLKDLSEGKEDNQISLQPSATNRLDDEAL